jgi:tetratricopeptide (TPR) repeat protein
MVRFENKTQWLGGVLLALAVVATYLPVWHAGFIWDDDAHVTENPCIVGPLGLKEIWTTDQAVYFPLVLTTFWFEHVLWGVAPLPFHLVNVGLHAIGAVLLWRVLLSLRVPGAWIGAGLWALHPLQVESVAWITEMKNTQSGVFYLLTILFYARSLRAEVAPARTRDYALTLVFAALALASKSSTVMLPLVLALCAWWVEGRWSWRRVAGLAPMALMAIVPVLLTLWTQTFHYQDPADRQFVRSFPERLATAGDAVWFYLGKLAWPQPLIFIYPRWHIDAASLLSWVPLFGVVALLLVLYLYRGTWARGCFFAFAYFVAALLPVLGLVDGYFWHYSLVEDHLQYLAGVGPLALVGAGFQLAAEKWFAGKREVIGALAGGVMIVFAAVSWQRIAVYQNVEVLWADTLTKNPACWMAHNNLGLKYFDRGQLDAAVGEFRKALGIDAQLAEPHNNIGNVLVRQQRLADAIAEYQIALDIDPYYSRAHNNLGNALFQSGRIDDAIAHYRRALEIDPTYVDATNDLGAALLRKGNPADAVAQARKALALAPQNADAHNTLGNALYQQGAMAEAAAEYRAAITIDPKNAKAHNSLGNVLNQTGDVEGALAEYQTALALDPHDADAHNDLGVTLLQRNRVDEAITQFQQALVETPNDANAHYSLGYALLQKGQVNDAITQFQIVARLEPGNASAQKNLAQAQELARRASSGK